MEISYSPLNSIFRKTKNMDGFTFFESYYDSAQHLSDEDQSLFYKMIMDFMFKDIEPEVDGHLMGFWLLVKPTLLVSKKRSKAGRSKSNENQNEIKTGSNEDQSPPKDKDKDKDKDNKKNKQKKDPDPLAKYREDPALNFGAFERWIKYKGKSYSKQGMTLSANKLKGHSMSEQEIMVDNSIMNGWKGLFSIDKSGGSSNEPEVGSLEYQRRQMERGSGCGPVQDVEVIDD